MKPDTGKQNPALPLRLAESRTVSLQCTRGDFPEAQDPGRLRR